MRHLRPTISTSLFLLFILLAAFNGSVRADDDKDADEYDETARVARVSMIRGDVQLQRNGSKSWEDAHANFPLVEGDTLATASADGTVKLWGVRTRKLLATFKAHADGVNGVAFSPDGKTLATGGSDRAVKLWDAQKRELRATLKGHEAAITHVDFSSAGKLLVSTSADKTRNSRT